MSSLLNHDGGNRKQLRKLESTLLQIEQREKCLRWPMKLPNHFSSVSEGVTSH